MIVYSLQGRIAMAAAITLLVAGCSHLRLGGSLTKSASSTAVKHDTVYMQVTTGSFEETKAEPAATSVVLRGPGASATFRIGEPIALVFEDVDMQEHTVETLLDDETGLVTMRVLSRHDGVVTITKMCQRFIYSSLSDLPKVSIDTTLDPQQIIITPLCNVEGNIYAYELRYGATERGCGRNAKMGLEQFRRCSDSPVRTRKIVAPPTTRRTPKKYFGL